MPHPRLRCPLALALCAALALAPACGADGFGDSAGFAPDSSSWNPADAVSGTDTAGGAPSDTGGAPGEDVAQPPPPEERLDFDLRTPEAGARHLFIPSAGLDALVVVDAETLAVHLVDVGIQPTLVRALPDGAGAVVLNAGSRDISVVRPRGGAAFDVISVDVLPAHNRLEVSPDGAFAFAWHDPSVPGAASHGSLQDVSAVRLAEGAEAVFNLVVGFRPSEVHFTDAGRLALFFCEDGVSGIYLEDLGADIFLPPIPVSADRFATPYDRQIVVTPDGRWAVVRDLLAPELTLVDLFGGTLRALPLPDWASDLELTPGGEAVIVPMRAERLVAILEVPAAFEWAPPEGPSGGEEEEEAPPHPLHSNPWVTLVPSGAAFGQVAMTDDGARALLFTTDPGTPAIGMLDTHTGQVVLQPLVKELTGVLVSPDGQMAALIHRRSSGSDPSLANRDAYSLLHLGTGFTKIMTVDHPVTKVIFTEDSGELFVLMPASAGGAHQVHRVATGSFAVVPHVTPAAPTFVAAMPTVDKVAIALDDPTGWITFVDTRTGAVEHVNSFELNSAIR